MKNYKKQQTEDILNSNILIYWWNFRSKTLDFNGNVKDYLKRENIKISIRQIKDSEFGSQIIKVKFSVGSLNNISFQSGSLEDIIRMVINTRLTYLGDKSQFTFRGRTRTINF